MDADSARYLVSALIQATAIAWALAMAVFAFIHRFGRRANEALDDEHDEEYVKVVRTPLNLRLLTFMNIVAFLTILTGILALASIEEPFEVGFTFTTISIILTAVFSVLTFLSMTFTIQGLIRYWAV